MSTDKQEKISLGQTCKNSDVSPCYLSCCKCGSDDIYRRFYKKGQDTKPPILPKEGIDSTEFVDRKSEWIHPAIKDCIVHHCRCCGYEWDGNVLVR